MSAIPHAILQPLLDLIQITINRTERLELEAQISRAAIPATPFLRRRRPRGEDILVRQVVERFVAGDFVFGAGGCGRDGEIVCFCD